MTTRLPILLSAVALVTSSACSKTTRGTPPPVPVTVTQAAQRAIPYEITATGTVEPIRAVSVSSQVSGLVIRVGFREGDDVKVGQVLVQIDARPYQLALDQAQAALARDLAQSANAKRQVERYQSLAQSEYVTTEQFEALRTTAEALDAAVKSDSAAVASARLNLEYTTIRAPIAGRTGSLLIKEGNLVRAPGSGPLVVINQVRPIQIRFAVPANRLPEIRQYAEEDPKVLASPASEDKPPLEGVLTFVDNTVDTTTGTILLKARFENNDGSLWPGQFDTATLRLYVEPNALVVPVQAVMDGQNGTYVFVVDQENKANTRPVDVGRTVGDSVIITKGVTAGETIVTDGQLRLVPGAKVQVRGAGQDGQTPEGQPTEGKRRGGKGGGRKGGKGGEGKKENSS